MSDDDTERHAADPEATVDLLKKQLDHLRRWFERERWKIEPQSRSFAPTGEAGQRDHDEQAEPDTPDSPEVTPGGRTEGSPEGPAGSRS